MEVNEAETVVMKILVLGDPGCGKTSLIKRYVHGSFANNERPTMGVDFSLQELTIAGPNLVGKDAGNIRVNVQLWDIAGQERSQNVTRVYYKEALGALIVYDITRPSTFDVATRWKMELDDKVKLPNGKPLPVVLIANKKDKEPDLAVVDEAYMQRYCKKHGFIGAWDTSAKVEEDVDFSLAVQWLVEQILGHDDLFSPYVRAKAKLIKLRAAAEGKARLGSSGYVIDGTGEAVPKKDSSCCD